MPWKRSFSSLYLIALGWVATMTILSFMAQHQKIWRPRRQAGGLPLDS